MANNLHASWHLFAAKPVGQDMTGRRDSMLNGEVSHGLSYRCVAAHQFYKIALGSHNLLEHLLSHSLDKQEYQNFPSLGQSWNAPAEAILASIISRGVGSGWLA